MHKLKPNGIIADRTARKIMIDWNDGHKSEYTFTLLREACPCAECRGGHANMGTEPDPGVFEVPEEESPTTRLEDVESVGTYGITPVWEDGHHYGIYSWEFLRKLCPCPECRGEKDS